MMFGLKAKLHISRAKFWDPSTKKQKKSWYHKHLRLGQKPNIVGGHTQCSKIQVHTVISSEAKLV